MSTTGGGIPHHSVAINHGELIVLCVAPDDVLFPIAKALHDVIRTREVQRPEIPPGGTQTD